MDAGEWTEAEPRQDGDPEDWWPHHQQFGKLLLMGGLTLTAKSEVRSLGVHLDPALTMDTQVASVVHSVYFHLRRIAQLRPYLDVGAFTTLVHALVISILDHCNALYVGNTFGVVAETSNGAKCSSQTSHWGRENASTSLPS